MVEAVARRATTAVTRRVGHAAGPPPASVTITLDSARILRPISPLIYGVAHANPDQLVALGAQLNRWGGNPNTRYNWVSRAGMQRGTGSFATMATIHPSPSRRDSLPISLLRTIEVLASKPSSPCQPWAGSPETVINRRSQLAFCLRGAPARSRQRRNCRVRSPRQP